ncbi:MAG: DsrE family protein [Acidobacteria bacterium]|nr:DsrE family protein [Acidobacteriota bacterium]
MNRVLVLVLADVETKGDLGRVVNALQTTREFKEAGDEVRLVFDGAGTRWIGELGSAEHKYHRLFESVKDRAGACGYCAGAFGVKTAVEQQDVTLLDEFDGHPSLRTAVTDGYQVISF